MGFAVPAATGAMVARPDLRAIVLVGDGPQMTGMELSTTSPVQPDHHRLDNQGYGTERLLQTGEHAYNDILALSPAARVLGGGTVTKSARKGS